MPVLSTRGQIRSPAPAWAPPRCCPATKTLSKLTERSRRQETNSPPSLPTATNSHLPLGKLLEPAAAREVVSEPLDRAARSPERCATRAKVPERLPLHAHNPRNLPNAPEAMLPPPCPGLPRLIQPSNVAHAHADFRSCRTFRHRIFQRRQPTIEPRLHRGDRNSRQRSDLLKSQILAKAQQQHLAIVGGDF